jgi:thiamine-monophosphate kinase
LSEAELVARMRELFSLRIGDDAAVVDGQVMTADLLIEDIDFLQSTPLPLVARKSLAVNLSDLAAMGAAPSYALLSLGLPEWALERIDDMLVAYAEASRHYGIEIIGGDLSRAAKLTIAVTAIGRVVTRPLLRSGAKPGDRLYLSRPLGAAAAGLSFVLRGVSGTSYAEKEFIASAIRRHQDPEPEVALGVALAGMPEVTACIDVSDGLSTDLHHLCNASGCGAEIEQARVPLFQDLQAHGTRLGINVRDAVLHGGEEFALLFTSTLREAELSTRLGRPVYAIGRMKREPGVVLNTDGRLESLEADGFDHFRPRS